MQIDNVREIRVGTADQPNLCEVSYKVENKTVFANESMSSIHARLVPPMNLSLPTLEFESYLVAENAIRIFITEEQGANSTKRFQVPDDAVNSTQAVGLAQNITDFVKLSENGTEFSLSVHEFQNEANKFFDTTGQHFVFSEYYVQLQAEVETSGRMFGLGERTREFWLEDGTYTLWARDAADPYDDANPPGKNTYGVQPVLFAQNNRNTDFLAILNLNANAQDVIVGPKKGSGTGKNVQFVTTGGVLDLYVLAATAPLEQVRRYHELVGKPPVPPLWGLGWQQSRYGYESSAVLDAVVANYSNASIPLEVIWSDIDYMQDYRDFTIDADMYADLPAKVDAWKEQHVRYVPIIDAGIAAQVGDAAYAAGKEADVFIKASAQKLDEDFIGKVWPGAAVFPDFYRNATGEYWRSQLSRLRGDLNLTFDGLWLDMNEASNFCTGYCDASQKTAERYGDKLSYTPGARNLNTKSIALEAVHVDDDGNQITEFDAHSLFAYLQTRETKKFFDDNNERTFIISRSNFVGSGKFHSHWLGDNSATYEQMLYSVGGVFLYNVFGYPLTGADICGFIGNTTAELCTRWTTLGAFYPFSRNHNIAGATSQEPYEFGETEQGIMRTAILMKYQLMRYYYTQMWLASKNGGAVFRPTFFDFPADANAYNNVEQGIMVGDSLKLSPVFTQGTTGNQPFYFPSGRWCPFDKGNGCFNGGSTQQLSSNLADINLHIRAGKIVPYQDTTDVKSTHDLFGKATQLAILVGTDNLAEGQIVIDDGLTTNETIYDHYNFKFEYIVRSVVQTNQGRLTIETLHTSEDVPELISQVLGDIHIYNSILTNRPTADITLKNTTVVNAACSATTGILTCKTGEPAVMFAEIDNIFIP